MIDDAAAVLTAFRPGERLVPLVRALRAQLGFVVVVDDSGRAPVAAAAAAPGAGDPTTVDAAPDPLAEAAAAGAIVVRHAENRGIAAALNTGIAEARRAAAAAGVALRGVVTFDQDSVIDDGYVAALVQTADEATRAGLRVGAVAPAAVQGLPSAAIGYARGFRLAGTPIQSGLYLPAAALARVGGFAEALFIDGVDTDYALRLRDAGLVLLLTDGATLGHSLGDRVHPRLLGRPIGPEAGFVVSRPFRYYYLVRNRVLLTRRHGRRHRAWSVRETLTDLRHCLLVLAIAPQRRARLRAIRAGLRDGWAGRTGRLPAALAQRLS